MPVSGLYIKRKVINESVILDWAKAQGYTDLADGLHVTVLYSRERVDWDEMGKSPDTQITITINNREPEQFDNAANVLPVNSYTIKKRHKQLIERGASHDYPEYNPHITFSYGEKPSGKIEPFTGEIILGEEIFKEIKEN